MKRRNWAVALALFLVLIIAYRVKSTARRRAHRAAASRRDAVPVSISP
jgi:hypothetical protein